MTGCTSLSQRLYTLPKPPPFTSSSTTKPLQLLNQIISQAYSIQPPQLSSRRRHSPTATLFFSLLQPPLIILVARWPCLCRMLADVRASVALWSMVAPLLASSPS
ncbi:unnamed protein product [Cuscuta europaea]|uniref:Uncharacterized protein n=1 Tax=Cuscuta europaea TaxID=41803 RepID=A0A9P0Z231_CUSEU|nr:unnamed protein product [Cuscuta europaea]